ncbi:MAG: hypothetical protein Q4C13_05170 [Clostridia bacterium]|nr:hypothetical protein [Clostridia bacterium]
MKAAELIKKAFIDEYWVCALRRLDADERAELTDDGMLHAYEPLRPGARHWCADPFLFEREGKTYLFCELMRRGSKVAAIGCAEIKNGRPGPIRPVLRAGFHLSYPAVFEHGGEVYMLPESRPTKNLTLWRATRFPVRWEQCAVLLEGREIADATPYWDGRGWTLFIYEPDDEHNVRRLYTAALDPEKGALGPLKLRAEYREKIGRPAGFPLRIGSRIILPTQVGVRHYGEAIAYRELIVNSRCFAERDCGRLSPACVRVRGYRHILGIHTVNRLGELEAIDVLYRRFAPFRVFYRLLGRLFP